MDRGSIVIHRDNFPENREGSVPIYVPPVVEGSNATIRDEWKTVIELKGMEFNWWATGLSIGKILEGDPVKAQRLLDVKTEYKITIQESPKGDFKAIIQTSSKAPFDSHRLIKSKYLCKINDLALRQKSGV